MTRWLAMAALTAGTIVASAAPAVAAMAAIATVAPVEADATEEGMKAAAASALDRAVRGARAMGLDEVMLKSIRMVPGTGVVVEILATDSAPALEESASEPAEAAPDPAPRI